ncbi:hypothetical protein [uncultured Ruegeria sp.]|uniref:hypothetical protein n=1 Tax=uncultured Ruegeria sp. TaxID=259304 RepID=UPI00263707E5|nr:hypothetical protein [uncultured Ruegeria sp.]
MKLIFNLAAAALLVTGLTSVADAKELKKQSQFVEAVTGKKLVSGDTWLVISQDGKIEGVGRNNVKITGAWVWNKRFWCRNVVAGQKKFPEDCQKVKIDGSQVEFIRNKGKGDSIVYTIAN